MGINTAGSLEKFYYVDEGSSFGVTPVTALTWGGDVVEVTNLHDPKREDEIEAGSRAYGSHHDGCVKDGFNLKARARLISGGYNWRNFFANYAVGGTSAPADPPLPTLTGQISKKQGTTYFGDFYSGTKCNKAKIIGESPGKPILFDYEFWSQYLQMKSGTSTTFKQLTGHQNVTVGANPADITTAYLAWARNPQINLAGGGLAAFKPQKWTVRIEQNLEAEEGTVTGADSTERCMATAFLEGPMGIWFECEGLAYNDETYTAAKMGDSAVTEIVARFQSGEASIHLANGYFPAKDMPEYKQAVLKQGFAAKFKSMSFS